MLKSKGNRQLIQPKLPNYTWFSNSMLKLKGNHSSSNYQTTTDFRTSVKGHPTAPPTQTTKLHLIFTHYDSIKGQPTAHPTQTTKLHLIFEHQDKILGNLEPQQLKLPNYT